MRTYRYIFTALNASDRIKFLLKITQDLQYYRYPTYICNQHNDVYTYLHNIFFKCLPYSYSQLTLFFLFPIFFLLQFGKLFLNFPIILSIRPL